MSLRVVLVAGVVGCLIGGCGSAAKPATEPDSAGTTLSDAAPDSAAVDGAPTDAGAAPQLAVACAKAVACRSWWGGTSVSACVEAQGAGNGLGRVVAQANGVMPAQTLAELFWPDGLAKCLAEAPSCEAVLACAQPQAADCADAKAHCKGDQLVACHNGKVWSQPCPAPTTCTATLDGKSALCVHAVPCSAEGTSCVEGAHAACPPDAAFGFQVDCPALGLVCEPADSWSQNGCKAPVVGTCDAAEAADHCEGDVAVRCRDGQQTREDCAVVGKKCAIDQGLEADCMRQPTSCGVDVCEGEALSYCASGVPAKLPCAAWGLHCVVVPGHDTDYHTCGF